MASYTRQSTFSDGDLITAALFNDEYNQLLEAFANTTGHKHDGTVGEGPVIGILGDAGVVTPLNKILIDTTNDHIEFWIDVSGTSTQQLYIADGAIVPVTDNDIDLGTSSLQFKDLYINGTANIDSLVADTADINGGTIDGTIIGGTSAAAITGTTITGTSFVIGSASIDETELEILDGATLTTTELNYVDGVTSSIQTQIDTKAPLASPSLTGIPTAPTASSNTNTTQIATTAYVQTEITELIGGAPGTLDTLNELAAAINDDANYNTTLTTALATKLPLAGGTMTGDVTYSDNVKAQFGTSNDLQIYHDGNHSRIVESGGGDMIIQGDEFSLMNVAGDEYMIFADNNSFVKLYYDGSNKLSTTSTGVDVTGTITADALTVDDITINGSTISDGGSITIDTEGDFIVDSEGDVYLDAAGNDWNLNSAGTNVLKVTNTSGDISIKSMTSDKDLIFKGVDGGSTITALTLDMSDAGKALFNAGANFGSGIDVTGTTVTDALTVESTLPTITLSETDDSTYSTIAQSFGYLQISADAGNTGTGDGIVFKVDNSELVRITSDGSVGISTNSPAAKFDIYHGTGHRLLFTTTGSDNFITSVNGANSAYAGVLLNGSVVKLGTGGTERARILSDGKLLVGKTAASITTAGVELRPNGQLFATQSANYPLLLNRTTSDGNIAQFRKDNTVVGNINSYAGTRLSIGSDSASGIIFGGTDIIPATSGTTPVNDTYSLGTVSYKFTDLYLAGTANFGSLSDGTITITGFADEDDMSSNSATLVPTQQSVKAYVDSQVSSAGGSGISFADNEKAKFGDGLDLEIYHDGSNSYIKDVGTGSLRLRGTDLRLESSTLAHNFIVCTEGGGVTAYHNDSSKLATTSTGIDVTGVITTDGLTTSGNINFGDNDKAVFGAGSDLEIYHNANTSFITESGSSNLKIGGENLYLQNTAHNENYLAAIANGAVTLYYNNSAKLATTSTGLNVTGIVENDGLRVDNTDSIRPTGDTSLITISGGNATNSGANYTLFGGTHATLANIHRWRIGGSEAARIDASGNLMVGKTTAGVSTTGVELRNYGQILATRSGGYPLLLNRTTSDGNIINLRKDGTTVGNINSVVGTYLQIGTGDTGVVFQSAVDSLIPHNGSATRDAAINLGSTSGRFKDLRLSGTAYANAVGIGTTSPSEDLHISGDTSVALIEGTNTSTSGLVAGVKVKAQFYRRAGFSILDESDNEDFFIGRPYGASLPVLVINTDGSERARIDSSGNLGIGLSSPSHLLDVAGDKDTWISKIYNTGSDANAQGLLVRSDATAAHDTGVLGVYADGGYKMMVKSTGNVGIGTTSPNTNLHIYDASGGATLKIESNTANAYDSSKIQLLGGNLSTSEILLGDASSATTGRIIYRHDGNSLAFDVNGSEASRFTSTGAFLVGKTADNTTDTGSVVGDGYIYATRSGNIPLVLNRTTSDGTITQFRKDNSTFGSISNSGTNLIISGSGTNKSGLYFGDNALFPVKNGSLSNSTIGFGSPNYRFTDLYLSGTAYANAVGIGTTSPATPLHISTNVQAVAQLESAHANGSYAIWAVGGTKFGDVGSNKGISGSGNTTDFMIASRSTYPLLLGTGSNEKMRIDSSGNVGIGTTSPGELLEVNSDGSNADGAVLLLKHANNNTTDVLSTIKFANNSGSIGTIQAGTAGSNSTGYITFNTDITNTSAERMRIHTNGYIGIGTTSPDANLEINKGSEGEYLRVGGDNASNARSLRFTSSTASGSSVGALHTIKANSVGGEIAFANGNGNIMYLNVDRNVGIGTTSPNADLHLRSTLPDIRLEDSDDGSEARISYNTAGNNGLRISADEGNEVANSIIAFRVDNSEKARIDSSGNLLVGTTTSSLYNQSSTEGVAIHSDHIQIARSSNICFTPNRYGTDGDIIQFRKDGSTVGSISAYSNAIQVGQGNAYLKFANATDTITPANGNGTNNDNAIDLGSSSARFKDLYLSGAAYADKALLGRTASTSAKLHLEQATSVHMDMNSTGDNRGKIGSKVNDLYIGHSSGSANIYFKNNVNSDGHPADSGDTKMVITDSAVGILTTSPTEALHVTGNILASGNVTAFSDERLKENIETLQGSKVLEMRGVCYTKDGEVSSGVIAQEIEKVAPELVHTAKDEMGTKSVAYGNLVGYLIEAIKDQQKQIDDLKERLDNGTS